MKNEKKKETVKTFGELHAKLTPTPEDYADAFGEKFRAGIEAVREAATIYAEALRKYPMRGQEAFRSRYPGVGARTWELLERIGTNDLHPTALLLPYDTAKAVSHIPIERQNRMFANGVGGFQVVDRNTLQTRVVTLSALTQGEASLLIDTQHGAVRSVSEQRQIILDRQRAMMDGGAILDTVTRRRVPYRICGNVCIVGGTELSLGTLKAIVEEMESRVGRGARRPGRAAAITPRGTAERGE